MLRFQESGECVSKLSGNSDGKEILVPLTGSMYVPGTLVESEKVIIVPVRPYQVSLFTWSFKCKIFFCEVLTPMRSLYSALYIWIDRDFRQLLPLRFLSRFLVYCTYLRMTLILLQVIVDVGTGYFMEKDIKTAQDYFSRKVRDGQYRAAHT